MIKGITDTMRSLPCNYLDEKGIVRLESRWRIRWAFRSWAVGRGQLVRVKSKFCRTSDEFRGMVLKSGEAGSRYPLLCPRPPGL